MVKRHKRQAKTFKLSLPEDRLLKRAARLEGIAPATFGRGAIVRAARRRVQREQSERLANLIEKQTAASGANR